MKETPRTYPIFHDYIEGNSQNGNVERRISSDFQSFLWSKTGLFVKITFIETRWLNYQDNNPEEFTHNKKTMYGMLKSIMQNGIEIDLKVGDIIFDGQTRASLPQGLVTLPFRYEQYDFRKFHEISELQELLVEGKNILQAAKETSRSVHAA